MKKMGKYELHVNFFKFENRKGGNISFSCEKNCTKVCN